jgi:hypothetical protein
MVSMMHSNYCNLVTPFSVIFKRISKGSIIGILKDIEKFCRKEAKLQEYWTNFQSSWFLRISEPIGAWHLLDCNNLCSIYISKHENQIFMPKFLCLDFFLCFNFKIHSVLPKIMKICHWTSFCFWVEASFITFELCVFIRRFLPFLALLHQQQHL